LYVTEVEVESDVALPGMFAIHMAAAGDQVNETGWLDDNALFGIGNSVEVKMGYGGSLQTLITGEITGLDPIFIHDAMPRFVVRGYDRRHRLHRGRKTRTFTQQKDSDIASTIAGEAGLTPEAVDSSVTHDHVFQVNQTNMEFLQERARRINYEVAIDGQKLLFRPAGYAAAAVLTLTLEDLLEFFPRLSSMGQVSEIGVWGWDPKTKQPIQSTVTVGGESSLMAGQKSGGGLSRAAFGDAVSKIADRPVANQAEADQMALATFNSSALALICGEGVCRGRGDLIPGSVVSIEGAGIRFNGQYYITATRHRYKPQDTYLTHFLFRRNAS